MKLLGNIIWLIFGGINIALEYFVAGLILMLTIVGIPFGLQSFKLGILALWPFGAKVEWMQSQPGCLSTFMNILWFFIGGIWICLTHIWLYPLHHHHRYPIRKNALPFGQTCPLTIW